MNSSFFSPLLWSPGLTWAAENSDGATAAEPTSSLIAQSAVKLAEASQNLAQNPVGHAWWFWVILLFISTFLIGIFGVMAGIGGGVLFVPLVGSFFPFHIDFVRGAGLFLAMGSSLSAAPNLLKSNLASVKLAMPTVLTASGFSIIGAFLGLWLSSLNPAYIQGSLGVLILMISAFLFFNKSAVNPKVNPGDPLTLALGLGGNYYEPNKDIDICWQVHHSKKGVFIFMFVGLLAGMFGLGAGWAYVAVLNLVMGTPLKVAVATAGFALSVDTNAAWIYFNKGAVLPLIVVPSLVGIILGSKIGSRLLPKVKPELIRKLVILVLVIAGLRSISKAFGV